MEATPDPASAADSVTTAGAASVAVQAPQLTDVVGGVASAGVTTSRTRLTDTLPRAWTQSRNAPRSAALIVAEPQALQRSPMASGTQPPPVPSAWVTQPLR